MNLKLFKSKTSRTILEEPARIAVSSARHSYEALRARMRAEGRTLQARAWSPETLPLPWPVEGLHWVPLTDPGPGPLPTRFQALLLRAPPRG